ncbi:MAG TPA: endolytic transglycosylase MltG [Marmoricola sp.]|nr:endolytic transglycosylase MltG [Marmoricola sp.]
MFDFGQIRDDQDLDRHPDDAPPSSRASGGGRGPRKRRGWIPALLVLLLIGGGLYYAGSYGFDKLKAHFAAAPDYPGPGTGSVIFEVRKGDSVAEMGRGLRKDDVVKSVDAFVEAARKEPLSSSIQVGFYQLKKQMKSSDALAVLVKPDNMIQTTVTVPEGSRASSIVTTIAKKTDFKKAQLERLLEQPGRLGLPASAKGNPEGYLYPATYVVTPNMSALDLLRQMVAKTVAVEKDLDLATKAQAVGMTPEEVLTTASILEFEASRDEDYPKVARAIYNRLDKGMPLQSDATVAYANDKSGTVYTSDAERALDSPYNTYKNTGLPPGPIGSPGEKTIRAALNPSSGDQLFWVVVNLRTGETRYADSYAGHLKNVALFRKYCQTSDAC